MTTWEEFETTPIGSQIVVGYHCWVKEGTNKWRYQAERGRKTHVIHSDNSFWPWFHNGVSHMQLEVPPDLELIAAVSGESDDAG